MKLSKTTDRILRAGFFLLIVVFFGLYLRGVDFSELEGISIDWSILALASIVGLAFRYWGVLVWQFILIDLGAKQLPGFLTLASIYAKAWLGRYIPGKVAWIAGKVYLASKHGISKSRLAVSSVLEGGMQIVSISIVSIFLIVFDSRLDVISDPLKILLVFIALMLLVLLSPPVFNRFVKKAYKVVKKEESGPELSINKKAVGRSFILYTIGAFITGTSYFILTKSIYPEIGFSDYFFLVGAFNLAGAVGMAAIVVPSGLGVREGIQLVLLSTIMPKEIALLVTVVSRLWSAAIDVLFYFVAGLFDRVRKN